MLHGPASDEYWSAPLRVLAVNMESYGYDECGLWTVDLPCLLDWMYDEGGTRTRTVRYTLAIIKTLFDAYAGKGMQGRESLRSAYADAAGLERVLPMITYYNIRPTSNPEKREDVASIISSGSGPISNYIRDEMLALDPEVILVAGHAGLAAFNAMWRLTPALGYLDSLRHNSGAVIQSVRHPSRPNYNAFASTVAKIINNLKET